MKVLASIDARVKLLCLIVYFVAALHAHSVIACALTFVVAVACAVAVRLGWRRAVGVIVPLLPIVVITVVLQVLTIQTGDVLWQAGSVVVTSDALLSVARMVVVLASIMLMSVAFMRCTRPEELVATFEWLITPLRHLDVRVEGVMFSLTVAFRFVPVFVGEFQQLKRAQEARLASFDGGVGARLASYTRLFAPLLRNAFRRADTLAESSVSRGFGCGVPPTRRAAGRFGAREVAAIVLTLAFAACVVAL